MSDDRDDHDMLYNVDSKAVAKTLTLLALADVETAMRVLKGSLTNMKHIKPQREFDYVVAKQALSILERRLLDYDE